MPAETILVPPFPGATRLPAPVSYPVVETDPKAYSTSARSIVVTILFVLDLIFVGFVVLAGVMVGLSLYGGAEVTAPEPGTGPSLLWLNGIIILVAFGVIPGLWAFVSRVRPWTGGLHYLGFTRPVGHASFVGVGLAGCMLGGALALLALVGLFGSTEARDDGVLEAMFAGLTWPLIVFIAIAAGVGEEIFFRGVLYNWLGWWGQAPLFALAHFGSAEPLQLFVTLTVGLLFGWLRNIGWSLWTLIIAHAVYDFSLLAGTYYLQQ